MPSALMYGAAGLQLVGGVMNAGTAQDNAEAQAGYLQGEINQEQIQHQRDLADLQTKTDQAQGRARAVIAAGGGDMNTGSALALLTSNAAASGQTASRLSTDSSNRVASIGARIENTLMLGDRAATSALIGGAGSAAGTIGQYSLLKSSPKAKV